MSDTPRTDSLIWDRNKYEGPIESYSEFCRELERELNAANERIKRLEEAGDELLDWVGCDVSDANRKLIIDSWRNAKEAKP